MKHVCLPVLITWVFFVSEKLKIKIKHNKPIKNKTRNKKQNKKTSRREPKENLRLVGKGNIKKKKTQY